MSTTSSPGSDSGTSQLDDEQRLALIKQGFWVNFPFVTDTLHMLEGLLTHPPSLRMPNLAIIGNSNSGKTMLINRFRSLHRPVENPALDRTELPILLVQSPPEPDEGRLYFALLKELFAARSPREHVDSKKSRLEVLLRNLRTRMIILDEFNHALAGRDLKRKRFLNAIKYLSNELQIPIVVAGTPPSLNALQSDEQLRNRFHERVIPRWRFGAEYARLLASIESHLPLRERSNLKTPDLAHIVLDLSQGTIGDTVGLVKVAASIAIKTGEERITKETLDLKKLAKAGWSPPYSRTKSKQ
ncbi:MAG: TniB family NTP-binding protein [Gammaproteobacteria bacterium]|nr:TniB family NTP-binding protein [Gammaproteobacteria bacterium]MCP5136366.1 TniB family NTP-binding protein [Gammaproteobacteria bacterium]